MFSAPAALTDAGRHLIGQAFAGHMRNEPRLLYQLSPDGAARLESILTTWLACCESPHQNGGSPSGEDA
jgi:hypothetical protein